MPSKLPSYLLRAQPDEMRRWKAAAASTGQSFNEYVKTAVEASTSAIEQTGQLPDWLTTSNGAAADSHNTIVKPD